MSHLITLSVSSQREPSIAVQGSSPWDRSLCNVKVVKRTQECDAVTMSSGSSGIDYCAMPFVTNCLALKVLLTSCSPFGPA